MKKLAVVWVLGLVLLMPVAATKPAGGAGPQPAPVPASDSLAAAASAPGAAAADTLAADSLRAAGFDSLAAPAPPPDYMAEARANFTRENRAYSGTRVLLEFAEPIFIVLMLLVMLFSGLSARLRDIAANMGHRRYVQVLVYFTLFTAITFALMLPISWYSGFALEHQYGLSNQGFGAWIADELKGSGFSLLLFGVLPMIALAYRALEKKPRTWWLWLAGGSVPVILVSTLLSPILFEPAFNKFTPLSDPQLKQEIIDLAARAGIPGRKVFEVNKSAQTKKFNAYVNGFGASQRIVLWDTTLKGMEHDEILFVMGHEMGHYRLGHIWKGIAFFSVLSFALLFLAGQIMSRALRRFGEAWGISDLHDIATLPLFLITLTILSALAQPATAAYSRAIEHEADIFSLELTHSNDAGARAFLKLGAQNRNNPEPTPLIRALLYDHPPLGERIRFALEYRPWEMGKPSRMYREKM